jgi:hypothetical protein
MAAAPRRPASRYERMAAIAFLLVAVSLLCTWQPCPSTPVLAFHMPAMARWLQAGEFVRPEQYAAPGAYPTRGAVAPPSMPSGEAGVAFPAGSRGSCSASPWRPHAICRRAGYALTAAALVIDPHLQGQVNSYVDLVRRFSWLPSAGPRLHRRRPQRLVLS